jgi:iron-sulfur cluster assembly protein
MDVAVTPAAEKFMRRLARFDGAPGSGFRLRVRAGGCSGLAADFSVEVAPLAGDTVIEVSGIKLFLPAESRLLLDGVTIDFKETAMETGFVFHDPRLNGCGSCGSGGTIAGPPGPGKG